MFKRDSSEKDAKDHDDTLGLVTEFQSYESTEDAIELGRSNMSDAQILAELSEIDGGKCSEKDLCTSNVVTLLNNRTSIQYVHCSVFTPSAFKHIR